MTVLALILALLALAAAGLALRRADVVERRARTWRGEPAPGPAVADAGNTRALSRVGVVRYDAFEDQSGRLSFSAAILDDTGRGVVLTAIHARSETRSYVKEVPVPGGQRDLSPEERRAVERALHPPKPAS